MVENAKAKREYSHENNEPELLDAIKAACYQKFCDVAGSSITNKSLRKESFDTVKKEFIETLSPEDADQKKALLSRYLHDKYRVNTLK